MKIGEPVAQRPPHRNGWQKAAGRSAIPLDRAGDLSERDHFAIERGDVLRLAAGHQVLSTTTSSSTHFCTGIAEILYAATAMRSCGGRRRCRHR